jgi:hypothetical protein
MPRKYKKENDVEATEIEGGSRKFRCVCCVTSDGGVVVKEELERMRKEAL